MIPDAFAAVIVPALLMTAAVAALAACTSEQAYNAIRDNRIQNCENLPIPQQAACRVRHQTTWEEYRQTLEALRAEPRVASHR